MAVTETHKPNAYWDRATNIVRDWTTDQALPEYQGTCLVYLDVQGPVFVETFLQNGKRCWEPLPASATQVFALDRERSPAVM